MALNPLRDLEPRYDVKGGSPKTPPNGISLSEYKKAIAANSSTSHDLAVSLRDHFQALLDGMDRRVEQAIVSSKEAVNKAEEAQERRLDLLNEFRGQSVDEGKRYALKETVQSLQNQVSRLYGGVIVVGVIGIANLVKLFLVH